MRIHAVEALGDNYIWALTDGASALLFDPGEARPALDFIGGSGLALEAILITHRHADHIDGIAELKAAHPGCEVIVPEELDSDLADRTARPGEEITPRSWAAPFRVISTPGHTRGHVSYVGDTALLCGDALFSCGCGRLFEGGADDLAATMAAFADLPGALQVCCGHEYTLANIAFARDVEPGNADLAAWERDAKALREAGKPTLPVTLEHERRVNPFLRAGVPEVRAAASARSGRELASDAEVLGALRQWKDEH